MQTSTTPNGNQSQRGQALVEFALVLLFIILPLIFVFFEAAILLFTLGNVTNAGREAARAGSIYQCGNPSTITCTLGINQTLADQVNIIDNARYSAIQTYLQSDPFGRLRNLVNVNQCNVVVQYTTLNPTSTDQCPAGSGTLCPNPGNPYRELDSMTVNLACPHPFLFGLAGTSVITLNATSTMRIEPGGMAPQ